MLAGCGQLGGSAPLPHEEATGGLRADAGPLAQQLYGSGTISHIVVIVQENRSVDNLFNGLPGADTAQSGRDSRGQTIRLKPVSLTAPYDISHTHSAYETEYAGGQMDGFDRVKTKCQSVRRNCPPPRIRAYGYVPRADVQPYFDLAERYAFADEMFETNQGPSFPAHQYLVSGTSAIENGSTLRASENPRSPANRQTGGGDAPRGTRGQLISDTGREDTYAFPCFDRTALPDLIDKRGLTWHYYQERSGPGLWNGLDAVQHIWKNRAEYKQDVITPSAQVLKDISNGRLANVTWITPSAAASDHAGSTDGSGPSWVASIVSTIAFSSFWDSTAIIVVWDDWGGWYDHVAPQQYNSYELGMRVPLLVISPYSKQGYVSHVHYEFGSILKFIEQTFQLGSMHTTDDRANGLGDFFDFGSRPRPFKPIRTKYSAKYFLTRAPSDQPPDND